MKTQSIKDLLSQPALSKCLVEGNYYATSDFLEEVLGVSPRSPALLDAIALVTVLQGLPAEPEQGQGEKLGPWTLEEPLTP